MANMLVIDVVRRVATTLNDPNNIHWTKRELLDWFNAGRREVVSKRPDANAVNRLHVCTNTAKQTLTDDSARLLRVVGNRNGGGITPISKAVLDLRIPGWLNTTDTDDVKHYVYAVTDPKHVYLYPTPRLGHMIEWVVSAIPPDTVVDNFDTDTQTILIDDSFANAIEYYVLSRAWAKDANYANNPALAGAYKTMFDQSLSETTQADAATTPAQG